MKLAVDNLLPGRCFFALFCLGAVVCFLAALVFHAAHELLTPACWARAPRLQEPWRSGLAVPQHVGPSFPEQGLNPRQSMGFRRVRHNRATVTPTPLQAWQADS